MTSAYQWGTVSAVHGYFSSTLASAASAGATSISTVAAPSLNALLLIGTLASGPNAQAIEVLGVSGSGPYDVALAQELSASQVSGASVTDVPTVDLYLDGASYLTTGVRHLGSYSPQVNDVTAVARGQGGLSSDRFALGSLLPSTPGHSIDVTWWMRGQIPNPPLVLAGPTQSEVLSVTREGTTSVAVPILLPPWPMQGEVPSVTRAIAALGTPDQAPATNPLKVGFYLNGTQFTSVTLGSAPVWAASTAYAQWSQVMPTTANTFTYIAIVGGTSGATEPSFPTIADATVTDGTVTWQAMSASLVWGRGTWPLTGNPSDVLQAGVDTYTGTTAYNLSATLRSF